MKHFQSSFSLKSFLAPYTIISSTWSSLWALEDKMPPLVEHASFNEITEGNEQFRAHFPASHIGNFGSPRARFYWKAAQMSKYFTHNWGNQTLTDFTGLNQNTLWSTCSLHLVEIFSLKQKDEVLRKKIIPVTCCVCNYFNRLCYIFQPFRILMIRYWQAFFT